jgi:prolipoprotein diacylglyceryltransferase
VRFPYTIHIGGHPILLHAVFEFLAIFIAYRYFNWLKRKEGDDITTDNRLYILAAAAIGAVVGSHVLGALENVPEWQKSPSFWMYLYGNKTLVGGLIGGLAGVELIKKAIGERRNSGDLFTFPLLLGMIIGRIGCFSAGVFEETYGVRSQLPWAMDMGDGVLRHPVTLYEIVFLILLWAWLLWFKKAATIQPGALFKIFIISYLEFRFFLDFIKPCWRFAYGLGSIQLACLAGIIYYAKYIVQPRSLITE